MTSLPTTLYKNAQVQELDNTAIKMLPIEGFELMMRAGREAFRLIDNHWPGAEKITVFCGAGNNGGDGYVVAGLAKKAGMSVNVIYLVDPLALRGEAKMAYEFAKQCEVPITEFRAETGLNDGLIVDALLGIGVQGVVRKSYAAAIECINSSELPVLAIDIPSGICGDTGSVLGTAVKAARTITYIGLKRGLLTNDACNHTGELSFSSLGIGVSILKTQNPDCARLHFTKPLLAQRHANAHKGMFGRLLIVAGERGYAGAGIMAAESALLCGAGIVELLSRKEHVSAVITRRPEIIAGGVEHPDELNSSLEHASTLVVGPGLGNSDWSRNLVEQCLKSELTMVVDADGLNILAEQGDPPNRDNWILTPHPGEAARLLRSTTSKVQSNRFEAVRSIQEKYGGIVVLKGAGTLIADKENLYLCSAGNPAMSTPGMGDVLAGIIGSFLAQGLALSEAAQKGVWAHATAADLTSQQSVKNLFATEIYSNLRALL